MRYIAAPVALAILALPGCGPKALALPEDPVQRAATCGVVAAASARQGSNIQAKLGFEDQSRILHYALIEGSAPGSFDKTRAATVANAMPALGDSVTGGKWEDLKAPCAAAFPVTAKTAADPLPKDRLTAQLGCDGLAQFMTSALRQDEANFIYRIRALDDMQRDIDGRIGPALAARGISPERSIAVGNEAIAQLVRLGPPHLVLDQCVASFGAAKS
jgi:hypothetical protein